MSKYHIGQNIILPANEDEGWNEEKGTVLEVNENGMYIVQVEPEDENDDGIREVHEDNMVAYKIFSSIVIFAKSAKKSRNKND